MFANNNTNTTSTGLFVNASSGSTTSTGMYGGQSNGNGSLFGKAAQPTNPAPNNSLFSNTVPVTNNNPPATGNAASLFGAKLATGMGSSLFGNNNNTSTTAPAASIFGTAVNNAANTSTTPPPQPSASLFGQPATTTNTSGPSLFGVAQPAKPAETAKPATTNPPVATNATTAPATSLFGAKPTTETTPATNNTTTPVNNASNNTTSLFGNATAPQPTTLFGANTTNNNNSVPKPAETTPAILFGNNNPTTTNTTTSPTNPSPLFSNNTNTNSNNTTSPTNPSPGLFSNPNPTQNNPLGAQTAPATAPQAPAFSNPVPPVNPVPPKDDLQTQFQKSNQTVFQAIEQFKTTLTASYSDLRRLADNALKFLDERQENQTIVDNFSEVEKMIGGNSSVVQQTLTSLERQQEELAFQIQVMSRKIGEGQYTHELSDHLIQYGQLKNLVLQLQQDQGEWNDPGQQQLINMFQSLNQVELQLKEMNELADIYLRDS